MNKEDITRQFNTNAIEHQNIMDKLEKFGDKLEEVQISIAKLPEALTEKFDERYASKDTEDSLKRVMWTVVTGFLVALIALVIKSQ